jgi:hypothetical protein
MQNLVQQKLIIVQNTPIIPILLHSRAEREFRYKHPWQGPATGVQTKRPEMGLSKYIQISVYSSKY